MIKLLMDHACRSAQWLDDMDPRDRLAPAHYRFIKSMSAADPMPLTPEGASAVKVLVLANNTFQPFPSDRRMGKEPSRNYQALGCSSNPKGRLPEMTLRKWCCIQPLKGSLSTSFGRTGTMT
ncbi:hypothetical protein WJX82_004113 [Trebouxia sp. C0006]